MKSEKTNVFVLAVIINILRNRNGPRRRKCFLICKHMYRKRNTLSSVGMKQHNPGRCDVFLKCIYIIIYLRMFGVFRLNSLLVCRSEFYSL